MKLPSEMTYWERVRFTILCLIALLSLLGFIHVTETRAHPDGATPYWYPSSFIYGYINGCAESVEQGQFPFTEEFWPDQIRSICGCVVDALRHSMTYQEILDNATNYDASLIVGATFPICIREEALKK